MNFERGLEPKKSLQIGIMTKARVVLARLIQENALKMTDQKTLDNIEKQFKEEVGLDMEIKVTMDRESLDFHIHKTPKEVVIISPWYDKLYDEL